MNESPPTSPHPATHLAALETLFGRFLPEDAGVQAQCAHRLLQSDRELQIWQVRVGKPAWISWSLTVVWPIGTSACPVLLCPDGCWPHVLSHEAVSTVLRQGTALAWFNRTELAFDNDTALREGPAFEHWPHATAGALAVWAWGLQRSMDVLLEVGHGRITQVATIGHSRGGKAALLAAAIDARFSAAISHNSGTAGAASLAISPQGAETLAQLQQQFPHWLRPGIGPSDWAQITQQDVPRLMLESIAPRGLCLLQASDDLWANPEGTRHMAQVLRPHWSHHTHRLQWHERTGGHAMTSADWQRAAQFMHTHLA